MHAQHRLERRLDRAALADVVAVDAQPVHLALAQHVLLAHDRHVVLRLAGDHAGVAADAGVEVDAHAPLHLALRLAAVEQRLRVGVARLLRVVAGVELGERAAAQDVLGVGLEPVVPVGGGQRDAAARRGPAAAASGPAAAARSG